MQACREFNIQLCERTVIICTGFPIDQRVMAFNTIALELVPPAIADGAAKAIEEVNIVLERSRQGGIAGKIGHLMIPGMIDEEEDRPVPMRP